MPSGDSLSVLLFLVGTAVGAAIGAVTAPKGWRARSLWVTCVAFSLLSVAWFVRPGANWVTIVAPYLVTLVPLITVSVVALMLRRPKGAELTEAKPSKRKTAPEDRLRAPEPSRWLPDITIQQLAEYLVKNAAWRPEYGSMKTVANVAEEIHRALYRGEVTAWGRLHPESEEFQIHTLHWNRADLNRLDGYAYFRDAHMPVHNLRFSRGQIEAAWPKG